MRIRVLPQSSSLLRHSAGCDCPAHDPAAKVVRHAGPANEPGGWSALLPVLACAVCPACLSTYAKVFSLFGMGLGISEEQHTMLLVLAVSISVGVSAWRSRRTGRIWPLLVAVAGSALIAAGHVAGDLHAVEWAGVLVLFAGGVTEQLRLRRPGRAPEAAVKTA